MKSSAYDTRCRKLLSLLKTRSFKRGNFTLASGKKSEYFIDCKKTILSAEGHWLSGKLLIENILRAEELGIKASVVAGVAIGGCSLASAVATMSYDNASPPIDAIYIRKEIKDHGTKNLIEGNVEPGSNIVLLEDTITTGGSSINALSILKDAGYNPVLVISIVDRLEDGSKNIEEKVGIPVISLFTIEDFK